MYEGGVHNVVYWVDPVHEGRLIQCMRAGFYNAYYRHDAVDEGGLNTLYYGSHLASSPCSLR